MYSLPDIYQPPYSIDIEIDVCLLDEDTIESGGTTKLRSIIGITSIPETHYVEFIGIHSNLGIFIKEGELKIIHLDTSTCMCITHLYQHIDCT